PTKRNRACDVRHRCGRNVHPALGLCILRPNEAQRRAIMRATDVISVSLMMMTLLVTDADAASNRWCASIPKRSENCAYATLDQCRAYVLGLGGWCRPNPFPGTAFGTSGTWSSGPPRQYRSGY